jgi:hypothetical protein
VAFLLRDMVVRKASPRGIVHVCFAVDIDGEGCVPAECVVVDNKVVLTATRNQINVLGRVRALDTH